MKQLHFRNGWLYYNGNNGTKVIVDPSRLTFQLGEHVYKKENGSLIHVRIPTVEDDAPLHPVARGFSGGASGNFRSSVGTKTSLITSFYREKNGKKKQRPPTILNVLQNGGLTPSRKRNIQKGFVKQLITRGNLISIQNILEKNNARKLLEVANRKQLEAKRNELLKKLNL